MWTDKHTTGIENLFQGLVEQLRPFDNTAAMKKHLQALEWDSGVTPSPSIDSPARVVQRALARYAIILIMQERQANVAATPDTIQGEVRAGKAQKKMNWPPKGHHKGPESLSSIMEGGK